MTLSVAQTPEASWIANGSTSLFTLPFAVPDVDNLVVTLNGVQTALWTLTGGGALQLPASPISGTVVTVRRLTPAIQTQAWSNDESLTPHTIETALDYRALIEQEIRAELARTIRWPAGEIAQVMPPLADRAGKFWSNDSLGNLQFVAGVNSGALIPGLAYAFNRWDTNLDGVPALTCSPDGYDPDQTNVVMPGFPNPGGYPRARDRMYLAHTSYDQSVSLIYRSARFETYNPATVFSSKRTNTLMGLSLSNEMDAPWGTDVNNSYTGYLPMAGVLISGKVTTAAGVARGKSEALVLVAEHGQAILAGDGVTILVPAAGGKLVGGQINVHPWGGTDPGAFVWPGNNDDGDTDPTDLTAFTYSLALNSSGGYRASAAAVAKGRKGYYNGFLAKKPNGAGPYDTIGLGGVWGGLSFGHETLWGAWAIDQAPGWISVGSTTQPLAPVDAKSSSGKAYAVDGVQVLGTRKTGWHALTGTATRDLSGFSTSSMTTAQLAQGFKALVDDLVSHGVIGT